MKFLISLCQTHLAAEFNLICYKAICSLYSFSTTVHTFPTEILNFFAFKFFGGFGDQTQSLTHA
jgi:hypothetical protein